MDYTDFNFSLPATKFNFNNKPIYPIIILKKRVL